MNFAILQRWPAKVYVGANNTADFDANGFHYESTELYRLARAGRSRCLSTQYAWAHFIVLTETGSLASTLTVVLPDVASRRDFDISGLILGAQTIIFQSG